MGSAGGWLLLVVVVLCDYCALLAGGLSSGKGFGAPKKKKKAQAPKPPVTVAAPAAVTVVAEEDQAVDKWGLPLDFDERAESEPDPSIMARCRAEGPLPARFFANQTPWSDRLEVLHCDPLVLRVRSFLTAEECDGLIALASSPRAKEMAKDAGTFSKKEAARRTSTTWYARFAEPEVAPLLARAAALLEVDWDRFEELQLARYLDGEQFKWHEDAVPPTLLRPGDGGQRIATLLAYLSGDLDPQNDGGQTVFRDLGPLRVTPVKGDALLFFPAVVQKRHQKGEEAYFPDDRTVHAADPVRNGKQKWVSQLWIHEGPYPPTIFRHDNPRDPDHLRNVLTRFAHPPPLS